MNNEIDICITARYLGTQCHLYIVNNECSWISEIPQNGWVLDSIIGLWPGRDIATICELAAVDLEFPRAALKNAAKALNCTDVTVPIPWALLSSPRMFKHDVRELLRVVQNVLNSSITSYYGQIFEPSRRLVSSLERCCINSEKLNEYSADAEHGYIDVLHSFQPDINGFASKISYDVIGGRTGRMRVISGPQILRLKRKHRDIIKSRFDGGKVILVDFVSLEARIAALEAGHSPTDDVYSSVATTVDAPRHILKLATLTTLFGGSAEATLLEHVDSVAATTVVDDVTSYFKVDAVTKRLINSSTTSNTVQTHMGRIIRCPDTRRIYNSFIQSTDVEIAATGFCHLNDVMHEKELQSCMMFIIHDAVVIDLHPNEEKVFNNLIEDMFYCNSYNAKFPLKIKGLTE